MNSYDHEITLITITTEGAERIKTVTAVFAEKKSIGRSEFYAAYAVGAKPSIIFAVHKEDYQEATQKGQLASQIEFEGAVYNILRTFEKDGEIELTCG